MHSRACCEDALKPRVLTTQITPIALLANVPTPAAGNPATKMRSRGQPPLPVMFSDTPLDWYSFYSMTEAVKRRSMLAGTDTLQWIFFREASAAFAAPEVRQTSVWSHAEISIHTMSSMHIQQSLRSRTSNSFREGRCFSPHAVLLVCVSAANILHVACLLLQRDALLAKIILTLGRSRSHKLFKTWRPTTRLFHWRHQGCSLRSRERIIANPGRRN